MIIKKLKAIIGYLGLELIEFEVLHQGDILPEYYPTGS